MIEPVAARAPTSEKTFHADFVCLGSASNTNASSFSDKLPGYSMQISSVEFESRSRIKSLLQICCEVCFDKRCYNGRMIRTRSLSCRTGNVSGNRYYISNFFLNLYVVVINGKYDERPIVKILRSVPDVIYINTFLITLIHDVKTVKKIDKNR